MRGAHRGAPHERFGALMRRTSLAACCLTLAAATAHAQARDTTVHADTLSYDDAAEVAYVYNRPAALRATEPLRIAADQTIEGNVAVLEAPLTVAGHVTGRVVVINGDVDLSPGARIDGGLWVTGGAVIGADSATIGGPIKVYAQAMRYRLVDDRVVALRDESHSVASWFRRWQRRHRRSQNRILLKGGTYNRVEGLPVLVGPAIRRNSSVGRFTAEALGIYRSADRFTWKGENLGYTVSAEMQFGFQRAIAVGAEAFDVVDAVEPWQLRDSEIGLASFFLRRDYRDYFNRHGARGYVSLRDGSELSLTLSYGEERWQPRDARDPFTLFRGGAAWRPNPVMDAGRFRLLSAAVTYDTRNSVDDPWTGWLITADVEHGWSPEVVLGPTAPIARPAAAGPVSVHYTRGFLDARRYNRVSPQSQLNLRLVLGGWLGGDPLPLERRFSLGGAGTLPGYDFRQLTEGTDVLTCSDGVAIAGRPAQCERVALAQVEYRGALHLSLFGGADAGGGGGWSWSFYHPLQWVVFADAGRGWLLHERADGTVRHAGAIPSLDTFRSDIGIGIDAGVLGVFLAKSLTDAGNAANFSVRLRHRF